MVVRAAVAASSARVLHSRPLLRSSSFERPPSRSLFFLHLRVPPPFLLRDPYAIHIVLFQPPTNVSMSTRQTIRQARSAFRKRQVEPPRLTEKEMRQIRREEELEARARRHREKEARRRQRKLREEDQERKRRRERQRRRAGPGGRVYDPHGRATSQTTLRFPGPARRPPGDDVLEWEYEGDTDPENELPTLVSRKRPAASPWKEEGSSESDWDIGLPRGDLPDADEIIRMCEEVEDDVLAG